ncbi:hypothetical protein NL676_019769 [Syzygium grande]|nr:hypothetical protein NL676_019769 [Syzygium grande]
MVKQSSFLNFLPRIEIRKFRQQISPSTRPHDISSVHVERPLQILLSWAPPPPAGRPHTTSPQPIRCLRSPPPRPYSKSNQVVSSPRSLACLQRTSFFPGRRREKERSFRSPQFLERR